MSEQKTVTLPKHLWVALDDMSRDASAPANELMEQAVEQFLALQGYDVPLQAKAQAPAPAAEAPAAAKPQPASLQDDEDDDAGNARTQARSQLTPGLKPEPEPAPEPIPDEPVRTDMAPAHKPGAQPPNITGLGPTYVPSKSGGLAAVQPAVTDMSAAHVPEAPKAAEPAPPVPAPSPAAPPVTKSKPSVVVAKPAPEPAWVKRAALLDADEERAAARERIVAIDAEVAKLTLERPTTTPLGQAAEEEE